MRWLPLAHSVATAARNISREWMRNYECMMCGILSEGMIDGHESPAGSSRQLTLVGHGEHNQYDYKYWRVVHCCTCWGRRVDTLHVGH
jgi:hypothetical protein